MVITSSVEEKPQPSNRMVANLSTDSWVGTSDQSRYVPQSHLLRKPSKSWMRTALCCELSDDHPVAGNVRAEQSRDKRALNSRNTDITQHNNKARQMSIS
ncbi:dual specificity tyrosine-phosphorylation-regulated kinase 1B isoform X1 [Tachysurus ichikawai]